MRILVTGAMGRLGSRLMKVLAAGHEVTGADVIPGDNVQALDVSDFAATRAFIAGAMPDIVLHPAAWTDVEGCAKEPEKAVMINGFGAQHVAVAAAQVGAAILYVSSNEVFDGTKTTPYGEYDPTHPINPYGYSKWVGEQAVVHVNPQHYIVRTSWLFAHGGKNFIQAILGAVTANKPLRVVTDEVAHPTYNDDLADAIAALITTGRYGTYHLVNEGACSRYEFARYFLDRLGHQAVPIEPITSGSWQRLSVPPAYTHLSTHAARTAGAAMRPWQEAVDAFLKIEGLL